MSRLLVTGGCGFIGSNFIRWLLEDDPAAEIVNLDKLTYAGNPENLASVSGSERYEFRQGDIGDAAIRKIIRGSRRRGEPDADR